MADKAPWQDRAWEFAAALARQGAKDLHNNIVPAFPSYAHGVDEPGTPLNPYGPAAGSKPSFEQSLAAQAPAPAPAAREQDKGMEPGG